MEDEDADGAGDGDEGEALGNAAGLSPEEGGGAEGSLEAEGAEPLGADFEVPPSSDWASATEARRLMSHADVKLRTELKRIMSLVGW